MAVISDWDDAYANGAYITNAGAFLDVWNEKASAFRDELSADGRARLDLGYGAGAREAFDLFLPDGDARGLAVFVHGGYWRSFDKSSWSHLARGAVEQGFAVAVPSYALCPDVAVNAITTQIARAITQAAGQVSGPIYLAGHSAGGHLVSRMACAVSPLGQGTGNRLAGVLSISGLHDLRPLLKTQINRDLRLDWAEATAESVALHAPKQDIGLTAWVGADERPEFLRQSALIANIWSGCGARTNLIVAPGFHHFDVIDPLEDATSTLVAAWLGLN